MTASLFAPSARRKSPSLFADWIELLALLRPDGQASEQPIIHELEIDSDDAEYDSIATAIGEESLDSNIAEPEREELLNAVSTELEFRATKLSDHYPFVFKNFPRRFLLKLHNEALNDQRKLIYLFCLLVSGFRFELLSKASLGGQLDPTVGGLFQICACLAAGGYVQGEVAWLGWPRPQRDQFLTALRRIFERFGAGVPHDHIPPGFPRKTKDAGIDVLAWKEHPDGWPSKIIIVGQCASGAADDKSVIPDMKVFPQWFRHPPFGRALPALFVPYPLYLDEEQSVDLSTPEKLKGFYIRHDARYGIIFDRLRIVAHAGSYLEGDHGDDDRVEGSDQMDKIVIWVNSTLQALRT